MLMLWNIAKGLFFALVFAGAFLEVREKLGMRRARVLPAPNQFRRFVITAGLIVFVIGAAAGALIVYAAV